MTLCVHSQHAHLVDMHNVINFTAQFVISFKVSFLSSHRILFLAAMAPKKPELPEIKPLIGRVGTNLKIGIVGVPNGELH